MRESGRETNSNKESIGQSIQDQSELSSQPDSTTEDNLNALINNQDESIWSIDKGYNYVIFNNHFKDNYKKSFNIELKKGMNALDILSPDLFQIWKPKYDKALAGERVIFEFTNTSNGSEKTYKISLNPVVSNHIVVGVSALSIDITERKNNEKALIENQSSMLAIMENTVESIWAVDTNYKILYTNSVFAKDFYSSFGVELKPGVNIVESLPKPFKTLWKSRYDRVLNNERFSFVDEIDVGHQVFYVEVLMNPLIVNGNLVGASIFANNITERKVAEEALKKNEARLHELNVTKDKFFSIIAHDLRSPFNSIVGFSDVLVGELDKKNYTEIETYAKIIQQSTHKAMGLLNNLLEWSRSQSGSIEFKPECFCIHKVVKKELDGLSSKFIQKAIRVNNLIHEDLKVQADRNMLSTIIRNLVSNAIKFTKLKGEISIDACILENSLRVSISDSGVGIDQADLSKLFAIDLNLSTPGTEQEQGSGLGLTLCKEFVDRHGGKIWAESTIGKGSTFCFEIPQE